MVRQDPFTIQLRFLTTEYTQPAIVGLDTGSREIGVAATTNGNVVFQAEVHLRTDIASKMRQRRQYRRNRRGRKTRYREVRYDNRRRKTGWLPSSLYSKAEATVKAHVSNVLAKLGLSDRTQVAMHAVRAGWVEVD